MIDDDDVKCCYDTQCINNVQVFHYHDYHLRQSTVENSDFPRFSCKSPSHLDSRIEQTTSSKKNTAHTKQLHVDKLQVEPQLTAH